MPWVRSRATGIPALALLVAWVQPTAAYATGAGSCVSPEAGHGRAENNTGDYSLDVPARLDAGSSANLTLLGARSFRGFLLSVSGGAELAELPRGARLLKCADGSSSVSHVDRELKIAPLRLRLDAPSVPQRFHVRGAVVRRNVLAGMTLDGDNAVGSEWYALSRDVVAAERHVVDENLTLTWFWSNGTAARELTFELELRYPGWVAVRFGQASASATEGEGTGRGNTLEGGLEGDAPSDVVFGTPFGGSAVVGDYHMLANETAAADALGGGDALRLWLDPHQSLHGTAISKSSPGYATHGSSTRMTFSRRADSLDDPAFDAAIDDSGVLTRLTLWYGAPNSAPAMATEAAAAVVAAATAVPAVISTAAMSRTLDVRFRKPVTAAATAAAGSGGAASGAQLVELTRGVSLSWVNNDALSTISFHLAVAKGVAREGGGAPWLSLGFSYDGLMIDATVVVAAAHDGNGAEGTLSVREYQVVAKSMAGLVELPAHNCVSNRATSVDAATGLHSLRFSYSFRAADSFPTLRRSGPTNVIWAVGEGSALDYHGSKRGSKIVDFATGSASDVAAPLLLALHVACMWLGFVVLLPAAVLTTQLKQRYASWFVWHRSLVTASFGCCILGMLFIALEVARKQSGHLYSAQDPLHPCIGLATAVAFFVQVCSGLARPPKVGPCSSPWQMKNARVGAFSPRPQVPDVKLTAPVSTPPSSSPDALQRPSKLRKLWHRCHAILGRVVCCLALCSILIGLARPELGSKSATKVLLYILLVVCMICWVCAFAAVRKGGGLCRDSKLSALWIQDGGPVWGQLRSHPGTAFSYNGSLYKASSSASLHKKLSTVSIGRSSSCDAVIINAPNEVSSTHCEISWNGAQQRAFITDLSSYGTFLNGDRLVKGVTSLLKPGDAIKFTRAPTGPQFVFQCGRSHAFGRQHRPSPVVTVVVSAPVANM